MAGLFDDLIFQAQNGAFARETPQRQPLLTPSLETPAISKPDNFLDSYHARSFRLARDLKENPQDPILRAAVEKYGVDPDELLHRDFARSFEARSRLTEAHKNLYSNPGSPDFMAGSLINPPVDDSPISRANMEMLAPSQSTSLFGDLIDAYTMPDRSAFQAVTDFGKDAATSFAGGANILLGLGGDLYGLTTGDMDNWASKMGEHGREFWNERKSDYLKSLEAQRKAKIDAADGELAKAGTALWETLKSPSLIASFMFEQVPMLMPIAGVGRTAAAGAQALGAGTKMTAAAATGAAVGTGGAMQGADAGSQAYDQLMALPDEVWALNEDYQARVADGLSPHDAKHSLAVDLSQDAAIASGIVSVGLNLLPGARVLEKSLAGVKLPGSSRAKNAIKGFFGEMFQEGGEEGSGVYLANRATAQIDPTKDLMEGVGEATGMGAAFGPFGAVAGALNSTDTPSQDELIKDMLDPESNVQPTDNFSAQLMAAIGRTEALRQPVSGDAAPDDYDYIKYVAPKLKDLEQSMGLDTSAYEGIDFEAPDPVEREQDPAIQADIQRRYDAARAELDAHMATEDPDADEETLAEFHRKREQLEDRATRLGLNLETAGTHKFKAEPVSRLGTFTENGIDFDRASVLASAVEAEEARFQSRFDESQNLPTFRQEEEAIKAKGDWRELKSALIKLGGLNLDSMKAEGVLDGKVPKGMTRLFLREGGMTIDSALESLTQSGDWIFEDKNAFIDALTDSVQGFRDVYGPVGQELVQLYETKAHEEEERQKFDDGEWTLEQPETVYNPRSSIYERFLADEAAKAIAAGMTREKAADIINKYAAEGDDWAAVWFFRGYSYEAPKSDTEGQTLQGRDGSGQSEQNREEQDFPEIPEGPGLTGAQAEAALGFDLPSYEEASQPAIEAFNKNFKSSGMAALDNPEIDTAANEAATSPTNDLPEPTEAQKEAGNYKKGKINVAGLEISIENPKGSTRTGKRPDGSTWENTMESHYGYIRRTEGADGEHVDVFVGSNPDSEKVYIVDQINQGDGSFDEHKVMLGFDSQLAAVRAYKSNYDDGWKVGAVSAVPMDEFKAWLEKGDNTQPYSDNKVQTKPKATAPEHSAEYDDLAGVSPEEMTQMVKAFADAETTQEDNGITHVFDHPKKGEIVRLNDKVKKYVEDKGWMSVDEAKAEIKSWKENARSQKGNSEKVVLSLFDLTGEWAKPWAEAGYDVYTFDIQADWLDLETGDNLGDINNFNVEYFAELFNAFDGRDVHAILAACPCTDFAVSGARHFAAKDADGRTIKSIRLVQQTLATIEYFKPAVWAIENPVGRIEKLTGLPPWRLSFDPNHLGDPYTKKTLIWGRFNADLPIAPVEPTEGSKMHKKYGGKSQATKNARSATPEGFAYGFFQANNAQDHPVLAIHGIYDRLDRGLIEQAVDAGMTRAEIGGVVDDFYYQELDDEGAEQALREAIAEKDGSNEPNDGSPVEAPPIKNSFATPNEMMLFGRDHRNAGLMSRFNYNGNEGDYYFIDKETGERLTDDRLAIEVTEDRTEELAAIEAEQAEKNAQREQEKAKRRKSQVRAYRKQDYHESESNRHWGTRKKAESILKSRGLTATHSVGKVSNGNTESGKSKTGWRLVRNVEVASEVAGKWENWPYAEFNRNGETVFMVKPNTIKPSMLSTWLTNDIGKIQLAPKWVDSEVPANSGGMGDPIKARDEVYVVPRGYFEERMRQASMSLPERLEYMGEEFPDVYPGSEAERQKLPEPKPRDQESWGSKNKVFTQDAAEKARALLKAKLNQLNSGIDPEMLQAGVTLAGYHIEAGARKFADFTNAMVEDLGEAIRPYLRSLYESVRHYPGFENEGMSDQAEIEAFEESQGEANDAAGEQSVIDHIRAKIGSENMGTYVAEVEVTDPAIEEAIEAVGADPASVDFGNVRQAIIGSREIPTFKEDQEAKKPQSDLDRVIGAVDRLTKTLEKQQDSRIATDNTKADNKADDSTTDNAQDSGNRGSEAPGVSGDLFSQDAGGSGNPAGQTFSGDGRQGARSANGLPDSSATVAGERGNQQSNPFDPGIARPSAGDPFSAGSLASSTGGLLTERSTSESAGKRTEKVSKPTKLVPLTGEVELANRDQIAAQMPFLTDGQIDDVVFAERRFQDDAAKGTGVLFTNGTGTGKTFTGLGVVRRFVDRGKTNIAVIVPKQTIADAWVKAGRKFFELPIKALGNKQDNGGSGVIVTTYANFQDNPSLADREWDLLIPDESHYLSSDQKGSSTQALQVFRALALQDGYKLAEMKNHELLAEIEGLDKTIKDYGNRDDVRYWEQIPGLEKQRDKLFDKWTELRDAEIERVKAIPMDKKPKALMLSATPFAYQKSVVIGQGFLFDWNAGGEVNSLAYNSGDNYERFMMEHFGYRMRYNKLTQPEGQVDSGLMERNFNAWLKKEGALSSRGLDSEFDYDRRFQVIESNLGRRIDQALEWLRDSEKYEGSDTMISSLRNVEEFIRKRSFDYHSRMYFLEAIKAREVIPYIQSHVDMGRKVLVMHDFKKGGAVNPFAKDLISDTGLWSPEERQVWQDFQSEFSDLAREFNYLPSVVNGLTEAFPDALVYNGSFTPKQRVKMQDQFNSDLPGNPSVMIAQGDAMREGVSIHDTTGKHQRVLIQLGLPVKPTASIQQEGRIYRTGQASDAIFRYFTIGTNWERYAFASTIAGRAGTAENLAMGEQARGLKQSFIDAFEAADNYPAGMEDEGKGGKAADKAMAEVLTQWDQAKALYFGTKKQGSGRSSRGREGNDYFATPEPIGLKMVEWADVRPGDDVLEPSAGHGAIARWFPETSTIRAIEPSSELSSKLALRVDGDIVMDNFENHNIVNKYDAIVMNPPFGSGGSTAINHLAKAYDHLREGGRLVALIPTGPAADKKFDKWLNEEDSKGRMVRKNAVLVADISLPPVTFERAGTAVNTHIVVIEKYADNQESPGATRRIDLDSDTIGELFDAAEDIEISGRAKPETLNEPVTATGSDAPTRTPVEGMESGDFEVWNDKDTRDNSDIFMMKAKARLSRDDYSSVNMQVKAFGGFWSRFKKGWLFKTEDARQRFLDSYNESYGGTKFHSNTEKVKKGIGAAKVKDAIADTILAWQSGPKVNVVEDSSQLPMSLRKEVDNFNGQVSGLIDDASGDVYLIGNNIRSAEHAQIVLAHEAIGHFAFEREFRDQLESIYNKVDFLSSRDPEVRRIAEEVNRTYRTRPDFDRKSEIVARLSERGIKHNVFMRLYHKLRQWLRNLGFNIKFTKSDLDSMIDQARRSLYRKAAPADSRPSSARFSQVSPEFFSQLYENAYNLKQLKGSPDQMLNMIKKMGGIKEEELQWTGLPEFLEGKQKVTKQEILDYLGDNMVAVDTEVKGIREPIEWEVDEDGAYVYRNYTILPLSGGKVFRLYSDKGTMFGWPSRFETLFETLEEAKQAAEEQIEQFGYNISSKTKFPQYTFPDGKNYREILLTLPGKAEPFDPNRLEIQRKRQSTTQGHVRLYYDGYKIGQAYDDSGPMENNYRKTDDYWIGVAKRLYEQGERLPDGTRLSDPANNDAFTGSHWDEANVLLHIRVNDRTGPNGEKLLFVEEIQSDWHQQGKKHGYHSKEKAAEIEKLKDELILLDEEVYQAQLSADLVLEELDFLGFDGYGMARQAIRLNVKNGEDIGKEWDIEDQNQISALKQFAELREKQITASQNLTQIQQESVTKSPPDAPFKNNAWVELANKKLLRLAAEGGYDGISWTTGQQQADRYDLSKHLSTVDYEVAGDGLYEVAAIDHDGEEVFSEDEVSIDRIEEVLGKEIAEKIANGEGEKRDSDGDGYREWKSLRGLDLKVGGQGMIGFYDRTFPNTLRKVARKLDKSAEIGTTEISFESDDGALNTIQNPVLPITASMRDQAMRGQPLFNARTGDMFASENPRIDMPFKEVTKRIPELTEAAQKVKAGEMSREEYARLQQQFKPVSPYDSIPEPNTDQEIIDAISKDKKPRFGKPNAELKEGHRVGIRLDIPAYRDHGVWAVSVHEDKAGFSAGKSIGYESVSIVRDVTLGAHESATMNIAAGKPKGTIAVMKGAWVPTTPQEAKAKAERALTDPDWIQVGFDPERHSYFYDRESMRPVVAADEVIQVGPLSLAKNPVYESPSRFLFSAEPDPDNTNPDLAEIANRVLATPSKHKMVDRVRRTINKHNTDWKTWFRQGAINQFERINELEIEKYGQLLDASESAAKAAAFSKNSNTVLEVAMHDSAVEYVDGGLKAIEGSKGLMNILEPLAKLGLIREWELWAGAVRASRLIQEGKENNYTQEDIDTVLQVVTGNKLKLFQQVQRNWIEFNKHTLDLAEAAGLIDPELRREWEKDDYVPFHRVSELVEEGGGATGPRRKGGLEGQKSGINKLTGGIEKISIVESMVRNTAHMIDASMKNIAMQRTIELAAESGVVTQVNDATISEEEARQRLDQHGIDYTEDNFGLWKSLLEKNDARHGTVAVSVNGKTQRYIVHDPLLLSAMSGLGPTGVEGIMKLLRIPKRLLTEMVTADPSFSLRNLIRDTFSTAVTVHGLPREPLSEAIMAAIKADRNNPTLRAMRAQGVGGGGFYDTSPEGARAHLERLGGSGSTVTSMKELWENYREFLGRTENANRIAVYEDFKKAGATDAEAAYQAMDVLNFTRHGDWKAIRILIELVPFMNARIQGLDRLYRGAKEGTTEWYQFNKAFMVKGAILTVATAALMLRNWDNDDYWDLEEWERDTYYHFFTDDGFHFRVPKPFEVGALFSTIPERFAEQFRADADAKLFGERMLHMMADTFAFDPTPQFAKPALEVAQNRSSFTGRAIVSQGMQYASPEAQYSPYTSKTMIELADSMPDSAPEWMRSPAKLEHLFRGYFGTLGGYVLMASDMAVRVIADSPERPEARLRDIPVVQSFVRDGPGTTKQVGRVYDMSRQVNEIFTEMRKYRSEGRRDKERSVREENLEKLRARRALNGAVRRMGDISARMRKIYDSRDMSPQEKRIELDRLTLERNEFAKQIEERFRENF